MRFIDREASQDISGVLSYIFRFANNLTSKIHASVKLP